MTGGVGEYPLGPVDDLPCGEGRAYAAGGEMVAVFRLREGTLRAVSAVCPHAGGPIADGQADQEVVICPLHQHVFELATGCSRTGQAPLRVYQVRAENGEIILSAHDSAQCGAGLNEQNLIEHFNPQTQRKQRVPTIEGTTAIGGTA
jgi:nitrite reductase (NADH) small subunit